jgi:hypothetical protein
LLLLLNRSDDTVYNFLRRKNVKWKHIFDSIEHTGADKVRADASSFYVIAVAIVEQFKP